MVLKQVALVSFPPQNFARPSCLSYQWSEINNCKVGWLLRAWYTY